VTGPLNRSRAIADHAGEMILGALTGLSAATLAMAASAPPLSPAPPRALKPVVSRAPARTVMGAIARAEALEAISAGRARTYRVQWRDAVSASRAVGGPRGGVVLQAVASTRRLAASGALRAPRLAAALASVHASAQLARSHRPVPAPGGRVRFRGDSLVYSYRPPFGLQVHPLGTIGKLNALATTCTGVGRKRGWRCRRAALIAAADRLVDVSVPAGPTLRFEYLFAFGGGRPGWVSAMTQGTGAQALARTSAITGRRRYAAAARSAYHALTRPAPRGGAVMGDDRLIAHFAMYSFNPAMRVLNGEEQSLIGVADYARITHDRVAARVARRGARELATHIGAFDTGAWTLYDLGGAEADMNYHRLAARFARGVCTRALAHGFCPAAARFTRYTTEAPRLGLAVAKRVRAPRRVTIAFAASKQTAGHLVVRDGAGKVVLDRRQPVGRFGGRVVVALRRAGVYSVTLDGVAINGRGARVTRTVTATPPPPKPKKPKKPKTKPKAPKTSNTKKRAKDAPLKDRPAADHGSAKRTKPGS
jgi:predicted secreted protein